MNARTRSTYSVLSYLAAFFAAFFYSYFYLFILIIPLIINKQRLIICIITIIFIGRFVHYDTQFMNAQKLIGKEFIGVLQVDRISYGGRKGFFKDKNETKYFLKLRNRIENDDILFVKGQIVVPKKNLNPGEFNQYSFCFQNQVYLEILPKQVEFRGKNQSIRSSIYHFIEKISSKFCGTFKGVLFACLLGDKYYLDSKSNILFAESGLSHFFALSGLHIGLILFLVWTILSLISNKFYLKL